MSSLFGTDGIRGTYGTHFITPQFAFKLATALQDLAHHCANATESQPPQAEAFSVAEGSLQAEGSPLLLVTAWDGRVSAAALHQGLCAGWQQNGHRVLTLGLAPTPACAFATQHSQAVWGVMISASHNPYQDNGFKIFAADGSKITTSVEEQLSTALMQAEKQTNENEATIPSLTTTRKAGPAAAPQEMLQLYGQALHKAVRSSYEPSLQGNKQSKHCRPLFYGVVDCAHGATSNIAEEVLTPIATELGGKLAWMHRSPDGFNINDGVGSTAPAALGLEVLKRGADFGIAFDGDGDRAALVDEKGQLVEGCQLLGLLALRRHRHKKLARNTVATTVMASGGLEAELSRHSISLIRTPVGDRHLAEVLRSSGLSLAGEPSGHLIMPEYGPTGDGLAVALEVMLYTHEKKQQSSGFSWHQHARSIPLWPSFSHALTVQQRVPLEDLPELQHTVEQIRQSLGRSGGGQVVWRYSGTEPKLRLWVEGRDAEEVRRMGEMLVHASQSALASL